MLTSLNIITPSPKCGLTRALFRLRGDSVAEEIIAGKGFSLRRITYTCRSGRVKPKKLYKRLGKNALVLAPDGCALPGGIRRFCSNSFSQRLCVNMALGALRLAKNAAGLRLGIYDPEAVAPDFLLEALRLCRSPVAVTYDALPYEEIKRRALDELGASAIITRSSGELKNCDLIVAPTKIGAYLPVKSSAVVLTAGEPYIRLPGRIYYKYSLNLPPELERLIPPELDAEYFCSALYSLRSFYNLGSAVPASCRGKNACLTPAALSGLIDSLSEQPRTKPSLGADTFS